MMTIHKYPRTQHIEGSRRQPGDEDLASVPFSALRGRHIVVEEKMDGANAGLRFDAEGKPHLQSRGHFLIGGYREKHFHLLKQWSAVHAADLGPNLVERYGLYGEWMFAKHTVFYDLLPHYLLEFDVFDFEAGHFLSTAARRTLLADAPIVSVPVLYEGPATTLADLESMVGPSRYKSPRWRERLLQACAGHGVGVEQAWQETDGSDLMEGLYIKVEEDGRVIERYKWVRASFLGAVLDSATHWLNRPIVPNQLAESVELFGAGT